MTEPVKSTSAQAWVLLLSAVADGLEPKVG
jgi:hypothetical protein